MLNRWVLSRDRKTATEGAEVTRSDRLFQTLEVIDLLKQQYTRSTCLRFGGFPPALRDL